MMKRYKKDQRVLNIKGDIKWCPIYNFTDIVTNCNNSKDDYIHYYILLISLIMNGEMLILLSFLGYQMWMIEM